MIAADKEAVRFSGQGSASDCWITAKEAKADGQGYVHVDLEMLLPCIPRMQDWQAKITLAPKGPARIKFGDSVTYRQGAVR